MTSTIAYVTDAEGNLDWFQAYVRLSEHVRYADDAETQLVLADDVTLVFGGDSQDKGIGDIRVAKQLVALKKQHPDRVQLIIGNRDANKMRMTTELGEEALSSDAVRTDAAFPYWDKPGTAKTPQFYLDEISQSDNNTAGNRLKWMLKYTMGSDGAFERRQMELAEIAGCATESISEDAVVRSYRDECDPNGTDPWMLEYLRCGVLAYRQGPHLFVHGGVTAENMGTVPNASAVESDLNNWIAQLNAWKDAQVAAFEKDPYTGTNQQSRAGHGLMDYGVPGGNGGATVVYSDFLVNGNAVPLQDAVAHYLARGGITSVVTGHKPHGDCPLVFLSHGITVTTADTSYSKFGAKSPWGTNNRGDAVGELVLKSDGAVSASGVLADGREYAWSLPEDPYIGHRLPEDFWVKTKIADSDNYVLVKGEGFKFHVKEMSGATIAVTLAEEEKKGAPQPVPVNGRTHDGIPLKRVTRV